MRIWSPLYRMERYHHVPCDGEGKKQNDVERTVSTPGGQLCYCTGFGLAVNNGGDLQQQQEG